MAPNPGLWPREACRNTASEAERKVYAALSAGLPRGWYAWHSLRIQDRHGIDGEADFVIADPRRGLLVLEVKGGSIEARDGRWFQNGRPMDRDPRQQALSYTGKLLGQLKRKGCAAPPYGVATCFPDTGFEQQPGQGDMTGRVLGAQDLPWLAQALPQVFERAVPAPPPAEKPRGKGHDRWIDALHDLWGETWKPRLKLGSKIRLEEEARIQLDAQQARVLEQMADNNRLLVSGGAGTGKTLLACETAARFARSGARVLLLCFTSALAGWLRARLSGTDVEVKTVRVLALELLKELGADLGTSRDREFWEQISLRASTEPGLHLDDRWDAIVIDEAQDLSQGDWSLVETIASGKTCKLWAFHDTAQAFWPDRDTPEHLFRAHFKLIESYRCPAPLVRVAELFLRPDIADRRSNPPPETTRTAHQAVREAIDSGHLAIVACPDESSVPRTVARELDRLRGEGLQPSDIAVISLRGQSPAESIARADKLGNRRLVRADAPDFADNIVADTFLRFKGLERPAVIVTDLRLVQDRRGVRTYIALTRALNVARIVAPKRILSRDPILASTGQDTE